MMGLPTEKEEDLRGIFDLTKKIASIGERQKIHPNISVSVSTFVPKPTRLSNGNPKFLWKR